MKKSSSGDINYELEYLRSENEKLKRQLDKINTKTSKSFENDIAQLLQISMRMKALLEACRAQSLPLELGRQIDKVLAEIENY